MSEPISVPGVSAVRDLPPVHPMPRQGDSGRPVRPASKLEVFHLGIEASEIRFELGLVEIHLPDETPLDVVQMLRSANLRLALLENALLNASHAMKATR